MVMLSALQVLLITTNIDGWDKMCFFWGSSLKTKCLYLVHEPQDTSLYVMVLMAVTYTGHWPSILQEFVLQTPCEQDGGSGLPHQDSKKHGRQGSSTRSSWSSGLSRISTPTAIRGQHNTQATIHTADRQTDRRGVRRTSANISSSRVTILQTNVCHVNTFLVLLTYRHMLTWLTCVIVTWSHYIHLYNAASP